MALIESRAGEKAIPTPRQPPPKVTMDHVRQALAGTFTETNANTSHLLERLNFVIVNRTAIDARREAGTPRPADAADHLHYEREIYGLLRRLNLFATGAGA